VATERGRTCFVAAAGSTPVYGQPRLPSSGWGKWAQRGQQRLNQRVPPLPPHRPACPLETAGCTPSAAGGRNEEGASCERDDDCCSGMRCIPRGGRCQRHGCTARPCLPCADGECVGNAMQGRCCCSWVGLREPRLQGSGPHSRTVCNPRRLPTLQVLTVARAHLAAPTCSSVDFTPIVCRLQLPTAPAQWGTLRCSPAEPTGSSKAAASLM